MPKRMRKDSTDSIKLEYNQLSNLIINDPQLICFGCGRSLNDSQFVLDVKNLPNHKHKNHLYLHKNCLRCYECKEDLEEIGKCFFNGGKIWCELHYSHQRTCSGCKKRIAYNEWIHRAGLRNYHLSCFNCNKCDKQLVPGEQFKLEFQDQKFQLICNMHFELHKECTDGNESDSNDSVSSSQTKNCNKAKRVRTTFTEEQLQILQNHFQGDSNPDGQDLERIATITGLSKRVTQVWFQNSRARQKKYMNKSRSTPTPLTNLNSTSLNSINGTSNGLILNCPPGTPNSSNSSSNGGMNTNLNSLQSLNTTGTNLSINSSTVDNQQQSQTNLSHSTNTNYSNNQLNSPYQDHSELNSPLLLMNNSFNNAELQSTNHHLECLNGSLNSLGSNSSLNSGSDGSSCNLLAFNNTNNLKKLTTVNNLNNNLINGLNNSNFTANRENINSINNLEWNLELQMKSSDNRDNDNLTNLSSIQNSSSSSTTTSSTNFTTSVQHHQTWRNLLDTNLCNTNALLTNTNDGSLFDYGNHNQLNKYFISGN